jgi:hypothetical protein
MNSTIRRSLVRVAALALPVMAVACLSGHDNPSSGIGQIIGPDSSGAGGTAGGSVPGTYKLSTFNGNALPDTIVKIDTLSVDSDRVVIAVLDSAILQLNHDSTATETDYFAIQDIRATSGSSGPQFNFSRAGGQDSVACIGGTYLDTLATQASFPLTPQQCTTFGFTFTTLTTNYAVASDSLVGPVTYQFFDSAAYATFTPVYTATVPLVWKFFNSTTASEHSIAAPKGVMRSRRVIVHRN